MLGSVNFENNPIYPFEGVGELDRKIYTLINERAVALKGARTTILEDCGKGPLSFKELNPPCWKNLPESLSME